MGRISYFILLLMASISLGGCSEEMTPAEKEMREKRWIYENMKKWYLWQDNIPDSFSKTNSGLEVAPFFKSFLYREGDQENGDIYSRIALNPDYDESKSTNTYTTTGFGFEYICFNLFSEVIAVVVHVYPDSPADGVLKRGDVIYQVDGYKITTNNYIGIFDSPTIQVSLAEYAKSKTVPNGKVYELSKATFAEDPIFDCRVIDHNGQKVGYLAFGGFKDECQNDLSRAFGTMRNGGATELVLDLRYNPGGYVEIANYLASLIAPTSSLGELFLRMTPNDKLSASHVKLKYHLLRDNEKIRAQKLELSRLVVLTSFMTASASETLIHCLRPFIPVTVIGTTTEGKNKAAVELVDDTHRWVMMPLFSVVSDKNGATFPTSGLQEDVYVMESPSTGMSALGSPDEKLLKVALSYLDGGLHRGAFSRSSNVEVVPLPMRSNGGNLVKDSDL